MIFPYEVEVASVEPLRTYSDVADLKGRFRHLNSGAIELKPGVSGAFNVGLRLYRGDRDTLVFEDRMTVEPRPIPPAEWIQVAARIPRRLINFKDRFVLVVDLVKEQEYWFEDQGQQPHRVDILFTDATSVAGRQSIEPVETVFTLAAEPSKFNFASCASTSGTIQDVVTAFEVLLGRNPENAAVISAKMSEEIQTMMKGIINSEEFHENVIGPLRSGQAVKRGDYAGKPSEGQLSWLFRHVEFDETQRERLSAARDWRDFFTALLATHASSQPVDINWTKPGTTTAPGINPQIAQFDAINELAATPDIDELLERIDDIRASLVDIQTVLRAMRQ